MAISDNPYIQALLLGMTGSKDPDALRNILRGMPAQAGSAARGMADTLRAPVQSAYDDLRGRASEAWSDPNVQTAATVGNAVGNPLGAAKDAYDWLAQSPFDSVHGSVKGSVPAAPGNGAVSGTVSPSTANTFDFGGPFHNTDNPMGLDFTPTPAGVKYDTSDQHPALGFSWGGGAPQAWHPGEDIRSGKYGQEGDGIDHRGDWTDLQGFAQAHPFGNGSSGSVSQLNAPDVPAPWTQEADLERAQLAAEKKRADVFGLDPFAEINAKRDAEIAPKVAQERAAGDARTRTAVDTQRETSAQAQNVEAMAAQHLATIEQRTDLPETEKQRLKDEIAMRRRTLLAALKIKDEA